MYYLGQQEDLERAERYKKIWRILAGYSYANPKVPEINDIVPLPPAKLPPGMASSNGSKHARPMSHLKNPSTS